MDSEELTRTRAERFAVLKALYQLTGADPSADVPIAQIADQSGLTEAATDKALTFLMGEKLADVLTMPNGMGITHRGIVEVESAVNRPNEPTRFFPANVINIGTMIGSQVQQGSTNSSQTQTNTLDLDAVRALVAEFEKSLPDLPLSAERRSEAEAELATLRAQLKSSNPKTPIIQESLKTLRNVTEGVGAGIIAAKLILMFGPALGFPA